MTETERINLDAYLREACMKAVVKHQRLNVIHPSNAEYVDALKRVIGGLDQSIIPPKRPVGRPKKLSPLETISLDRC